MTRARTAGRAGRPWRTVQAQVYREETHCWLCGDWVDQTLPAQHAKARSADHLRQLQHGGQPHTRSNLRLAHIGCNSGRSNRLRGLTPDQCACTLGQPCGRLQPRGWISVDATQV